MVREAPGLPLLRTNKQSHRSPGRDKSDLSGSRGNVTSALVAEASICAPDDALAFVLVMFCAPIMLCRWYMSISSDAKCRAVDTEGSRLSISKGVGVGVWRRGHTDWPRREDRGSVQQTDTYTCCRDMRLPSGVVFPRRRISHRSSRTDDPARQ